MKVWEAAIIVLEETDNPAVMWGDEGLCHMIATAMGWKHDAWNTSTRVLAALAKSPGKLVKGKTRTGGGRLVNVFRLPERPVNKPAASDENK